MVGDQQEDFTMLKVNFIDFLINLYLGVSNIEFDKPQTMLKQIIPRITTTKIITVLFIYL